MMHSELLKLLRCPETHQELRVAEPELLERLNRLVAERRLRDRADRVVEEVLEGGLLRADGQSLYPVRHGIPVMLVDESIPLSGAGTDQGQEVSRA